MAKDITDIVTQIEEILKNPDNDPADIVGSRVVGVTIVKDDIESYYEQFPLLEEVAELGVELEMINQPDLSNEVMQELQTKFSLLKLSFKKRE